jgi:RecB family exonuclease
MVPIADRTLAFRGRIDRVDRAPDGERLVVLDYKSGGVWEGHRHLHQDAVHRGQLLQLPVYALAARERFRAAAVAAYYWFVTERQSYASKGYAVDDRRLARFRHVLGIIVAGIENGLFPARPGSSRQDGFENCQICPYDRVCPGARADLWRRKRNAAELRPYLDLAEPVDAP